LTAISITLPLSSWPTVDRYSSCHGVALAGTGGMPAFLRLAISASSTSMSQRPAPRSMRMRSPVRSHASPPPAALSGEALRIDGLSEVPDCRPSPMVGRLVMPRFSSASGGCMFTTSAEPGQPSGPEPRITRIVRSSMPRDASLMRA
jgi:hypothetical protein